MAPPPSPLLQIPEDGDVSRAPGLLTVLILTGSIALLCVGLRLYVRTTIVKGLGWDDYTLIVAVLFGIVEFVLDVLSISVGHGRHDYYINLESPDKLIEETKYAQLTILPNLLACMFTRISLCLFLLRIVGKIQVHRIFLWSILLLTVIMAIINVIYFLARCQPIEKIWNRNANGTCLPAESQVVVATAQAVITIASDWLVALFPLLILRNLNMALKTKIALTILMGLGVFVGVAALIKTLQIRELKYRSDISWSTYELGILSVLEQNLGIIVVSIPAIRPLFSRAFRLGTRATNRLKEQYRNATADGQPTDFGHQLSNMSGRGKGPTFSRTTATATSTKPGQFDDNESDTSLVNDKSAAAHENQIMKTVSISLQSRAQGEKNRDPELGGGRWNPI